MLDLCQELVVVLMLEKGLEYTYLLIIPMITQDLVGRSMRIHTHM